MIDNTNGFSIEHKIQSNSHLQCPIWKTLKKKKKPCHDFGFQWRNTMSSISRDANEWKY